MEKMKVKMNKKYAFSPKNAYFLNIQLFVWKWYIVELGWVNKPSKVQHVGLLGNVPQRK